MNSNLFHNILNVAMAAVAALSVPEVIAILPPDTALTATGVLATLKVVINVIRDGVTGLAKKQPPVQ